MMHDRLNILFVSAECAPFAKTGGLGDVAGSLPGYLSGAGHKVAVVMPLYSVVDRNKHKIIPAFDHLDVPYGNEMLACSVYKSVLPGDVPVYFLEHHDFYSRTGLYHDAHFNDYNDNGRRFGFLSKAALQLCYLLNFKPDIIHVNDWHTAVLPALLKRMYNDDPVFSETATVLTIHNIAYQGRYNRLLYFNTGLGWEDFTQDKFEHFGDVNFLKGGIHFADAVNTVSPGYADETRSAPGGYGMEYFLNKKGEHYTGILNGADYTQWDPDTDKLIPANYSINDMSGKAICKKALQRQLGLKQHAHIPVIGVVSRLVEQKGFHYVADCIEDLLLKKNVQLAILGSGEKRLEEFFTWLAHRFPGKVGTYIGYDNDLAHLIEAGSDFFLMPSVYEPCGLNQIYSLRYGTLPIVRATGGLNDTVENYVQETGEGTGFKFHEPSCTAVYNTITWAIETWYYRREHINKLAKNAMKQNFSWDESVKEYEKLYLKALRKVRKDQPVTTYF
jgi:starch synthase